MSLEQSSPKDSIQIFDVSYDDPLKFRWIGNIDGAPYPEGLAMSPKQDRLYVATQGGGGHDPVVIVDTTRDEVVGNIQDLEVGTSVAVSKDGARLFVGRGNQPCHMPGSDEVGAPLSVIDTADLNIVNTLCLHMSVGELALSGDPQGNYLLVANGSVLSIFDTRELDHAIKATIEISLEGSVQGLGVAQDNSVYAFIPISRRMFLYVLPKAISPGLMDLKKP